MSCWPMLASAESRAKVRVVVSRSNCSQGWLGATTASCKDERSHLLKIFLCEATRGSPKSKNNVTSTGWVNNNKTSLGTSSQFLQINPPLQFCSSVYVWPSPAAH
jgi:hypothetical protein